MKFRISQPAGWLAGWRASGGAAGTGRAAGTFIVAFNVYRTNSLTCSSRRSRNFQRRLGTLRGSNKISHLAGAAVLTFSAAFANERDASAPGSTVSRRPARLLVPRARTTIRSLINGQTNCLCLPRGYASSSSTRDNGSHAVIFRAAVLGNA